jgi:serine/threonine protein kinase
MDLSNLKPGYRPIPGKPYELTEELGQGGFGAVWKGKNEKLGRFFVFKFCNEPLNPTKLISLHNELRLVSKLNHPEIVQLHDEYLELKPPYLPCLIYDFVEGVDLHTVLAERKMQERSLSVEEATGLILKIAEIIAYVHSHPEKIVHRDLKPANILVTNPHDLALLSAIGGHADLRLARLKVMDFGIGARSSHGRDSASRMNSYGIAFDGFRSEGYASPQQEHGEPATECDDVYALGAMWQQFLMGHVPRGTGWNRTLQKKQMTEKQIQVVEACMEDDCDHRIPNAKAMAEKIRSTMPNAALTDSFEESFRKACLAVDEDTEIQIRHLNVDSAALLAANWKHDKLSLPKLEFLSIEAAGKLATWEGDTLELNGLTGLSPETAGALAKWEGGELILNGLTSLTPETAEKLATWEGASLYLNGLTSLSPETAEKLATWKGFDKEQESYLYLKGLTILSPNAAEKLATWKGWYLHLDGLTSLTPETAEPFVMWRGYKIGLKGIEKFSRQTAEALFWKAAEAGGWALAQELLTELLKVDFARVSGNKVLFMAVKADRGDVIYCLRREIKGYSPNLSITLAETGDTPLHLAAKLGHHNVVEYLLDAGAKPQGKNKEGKTALQCAMDSGSMETVRLLVPKDT